MTIIGGGCMNKQGTTGDDAWRPSRSAHRWLSHRRRLDRAGEDVALIRRYYHAVAEAGGHVSLRSSDDLFTTENTLERLRRASRFRPLGLLDRIILAITAKRLRLWGQ